MWLLFLETTSQKTVAWTKRTIQATLAKHIKDDQIKQIVIRTHRLPVKVNPADRKKQHRTINRTGQISHWKTRIHQEKTIRTQGQTINPR